MQLKSVNALLLGIAIGAIAVGAATAVTAAGDSTITACANKSTGAMRLLSKGSCRKTETRVTWNQQGSQGPAGIPGPAGVKGETGAKGDPGVATNGVNGQNYVLVDSAGTVVGPVTGLVGNSATVLVGGYLWDVTLQGYVDGQLGVDLYFADAACTMPYGYGIPPSGSTAPPQIIGVSYGANRRYDPTDDVWRASGASFTFSSKASLYGLTGSSCVAVTSEQKASRDLSGWSLFDLVPVAERLRFQAPLRIESR